MTISFEKSLKDRNNLMIVDGLNLAFRYKHAGQYDFKEDYLKTINSLKVSYKAKDVVIALDKGGSSFRRGIFPEYKANRAEKVAEQTEQERLDFEEFIKGFQEAIRHLVDNSEHKAIRFEGVEADDIAAYLCTEYHNSYNHIWLISTDRDWDLLINDKTSRFSYVSRKEITTSNWGEHYDFPIKDFLSIKVLMGDDGDNVPGVAGIGPKRASSLVSKYGDAFEILNQLPLPGNSKYIQNLNNFGSSIITNFQLVDIVSFHRDAIGKENINQIDRIMND